MKTIKKQVITLRGRGENCQCSDCPFLYGAADKLNESYYKDYP